MRFNKPARHADQQHKPSSKRRRLRVATALALALLGAAAGTVAAPTAQAAASCPDGGYTGVPGERIKAPNSPSVYLVDPEGFRRAIPDEQTYNYFFRSWNGIITRSDVHCIHRGPDLWGGNFLVKSNTSPTVYFMDGQGIQQWLRPIPSETAFNKYHFRWDSIYVEDASWFAGKPIGRTWS